MYSLCKDFSAGEEGQIRAQENFKACLLPSQQPVFRVEASRVRAAAVMKCLVCAAVVMKCLVCDAPVMRCILSLLIFSLGLIRMPWTEARVEL
jgi:hypothetical protein